MRRESLKERGRVIPIKEMTQYTKIDFAIVTKTADKALNLAVGNPGDRRSRFWYFPSIDVAIDGRDPVSPTLGKRRDML